MNANNLFSTCDAEVPDDNASIPSDEAEDDFFIVMLHQKAEVFD